MEVLKEVEVLLKPLTDKSLSAEEHTRLIRQASEMTKSLKLPIERTPELERLVHKIRRLMMGYTD
jgi:hypothetical protein